MIKSFTTVTQEPDSSRAGAQLARSIRAAFDGAEPHAVVIFASARHDHARLLDALAAGCGQAVIVGSSSAGEFTRETRGVGSISLLALRSDTVEFAMGIGRDVRASPANAAQRVVGTFRGMSQRPKPYRAALVMTDALAGFADVVVEELTLATGGNYSFFGGGAGDDARFEQTHVFAGTEVLTNAVVALEILSIHPIGVGVSHGWESAGARYRVTEADGRRLVSLNGVPAVEAFVDHAEATGQAFDRVDPLPFFLHNILGIEGPGGMRLRVPLALENDGTVVCAAAVPQGAIVCIMRTNEESAVRAAEQATGAAIKALGKHEPAVGLVFDCVATRLRLGRAFDDELSACATLLAPAKFVGCNTYGQIARAEGQFGGFHNCTAVVCVLAQ